MWLFREKTLESIPGKRVCVQFGMYGVYYGKKIKATSGQTDASQQQLKNR